MDKIKKGDIVGRKSYGKDIIFIVEKIIQYGNNKRFAILKGITVRIIADSDLDDLEKVDKICIQSNIKILENRLESRINRKENYISNTTFQTFKRDNNIFSKKIYTGRILHLDGDRKYTDKSYKHYNDLGLDSIVKNVPENRQPNIVVNLLEKYRPDILVITGHDGMIRHGTGYNDLYNYRNSRYFVNTVQEARRWDIGHKLVIFAGACQSYFEALMTAGANFASSPARILIDFADPLIVAEKIATTENYKYITISDIANDLRDGEKGIGGVGASGKKEILLM